VIVGILVWGGYRGVTNLPVHSRPSPPAPASAPAPGRAGDAPRKDVPAATSAPARPPVSTGPEWPQPTAKEQARRRQEINRFYAALRTKESSDGEHLVGDKGKSAGPYHISKQYQTDALEGTTLDWKWPEAAMDRDKGEYIIFCYMMRHAYFAWVVEDWETCARIHNGGPDGDLEPATAAFWREVSEIMENDDER